MNVYESIFESLQNAVDCGELPEEFAEAVNDLAYDKYGDDEFEESTRFQREAVKKAKEYNDSMTKLKNGNLSNAERKLYTKRAEEAKKYLKDSRVGDAALKSAQNYVRGRNGSDLYEDYLRGGEGWAQHIKMKSDGLANKKSINDSFDKAKSSMSGYKYSATLPERPLTKAEVDAANARALKKKKDDRKKTIAAIAIPASIIGSVFGLASITSAMQRKSSTVSDKNVGKYVTAQIMKLENEIVNVDEKTKALIDNAPESEAKIVKAANIKKDYLKSYIADLKKVHTAVGFQLTNDKYSAKAVEVTARANKILYKTV